MPKRRGYRKRRGARRRRAARNAPILRRILYAPAKCTSIIEVTTSGSGASTIAKSFARFQPQALVAEQYGFNSSQRWSQMSRNWEEFAVTGMRIEWIPTNLVGMSPDGSTVVGQIKGLWMFDDIDTYNTNNYTD